MCYRKPRCCAFLKIFWPFNPQIDNAIYSNEALNCLEILFYLYPVLLQIHSKLFMFEKLIGKYCFHGEILQPQPYIMSIRF